MVDLRGQLFKHRHFFAGQTWHARTARYLEWFVPFPWRQPLQINDFQLKYFSSLAREAIQADRVVIQIQNKKRKMDKDLWAQWQHQKEQLSKLRMYAFKLSATGFAKRSLLIKTLTIAYNMAIRLRHLLDQALTRFMRFCITEPLGEILIQAGFPFASKVKWLEYHFILMTKLTPVESNHEVEHSQKQEDNDGLVLQRLQQQFPQVWREICKVQPFQQEDFIRDSWLVELVAVANDAKHVRYFIPTSAQLHEWGEEGKVQFQNYCTRDKEVEMNDKETEDIENAMATLVIGRSEENEMEAENQNDFLEHQRMEKAKHVEEEMDNQKSDDESGGGKAEVDNGGPSEVSDLLFYHVDFALPFFLSDSRFYAWSFVEEFQQTISVKVSSQTALSLSRLVYEELDKRQLLSNGKPTPLLRKQLQIEQTRIELTRKLVASVAALPSSSSNMVQEEVKGAVARILRRIEVRGCSTEFVRKVPALALLQKALRGTRTLLEVFARAIWQQQSLNVT